MKVIRWLLSFYILGYLFYHLTPVFYTVHVNYAPPKPAPKLITFSEREDPYGLLNPRDCKPILSDFPVLVSTPLREFPSYSFVLGKRWNFAKVEGKKVLMLVYRNGRLLEIYDQPLLTLNLEEEGSYQLKVYSYKFKAFGFYFGLRFVGCLSEIRVKRAL